MNVRPELDVSKLGLAQAAQALECIVLDKIVRVLDVRAQQLLLPRARPQCVANVLEKYSATDVQALLRLFALHNEHRLSNERLCKDWYAHAKCVLESFELAQLSKALHSGMLKEVLRAKRANGLAAGSDETPTVSIVPEQVWPYVLTLAFQTSRYTECSCKLVRDHVLNRYYVSRGEPPLPTLHPNTSLLLLLAVPHNPSHAAHLDAYEQTIREIAQLLVLPETWASFWDQWLLTESLLAFPQEERLTSKSSTRVSKITVGGSSTQEPAAMIAAVLAHSDGENKKPSWIPAGSGARKGSDVQRRENQTGR